MGTKTSDRVIFNELYCELSYKCNARCRHCYLSCSPNANGITIPVEKWVDTLSQVKESHLVGLELVIAGGEPTLFLNETLHILVAARNLGYKTAIITHTSQPETAINPL